MEDTTKEPTRTITAEEFMATTPEDPYKVEKPAFLTMRKNEKLRKTMVRRGEKLISVTSAEREKKIEEFVNEFIANGGNATKAAMKAFNLTNKVTAGTVGHVVMNEVKGMARIYLENKGATYGNLLETAIEKMKESKTTEWWDRLMKMSGYDDFLGKETKSSPVAVNIISGQKDFLSGYIEEGEVVEEESED